MNRKKDIESLYDEMSNLYGDSSEINDSIDLPDGSILEFFHTYTVPESYNSKTLVTQYRLVANEPEETLYSLSGFYRLSTGEILNNYTSTIFSDMVKFTSYQLKIYDPNNASVPILSTKKEYIPGIFGKYPEQPFNNRTFRITLKLKGSVPKGNMPTLWYRDLYLHGIPKTLQDWDNPDSEDEGPVNAFKAFIKAFSLIRSKNYSLYCIGVNKGTKNEFIKENLELLPKVISAVPKGFV